jgi:hypothetical protein
MTRPILALLVLAMSIPPLYAQGTILYTDRSGYTTGIDGSRTVNTYTDSVASTSALTVTDTAERQAQSATSA